MPSIDEYECLRGSAKLAGNCYVCPPGTYSLGGLSQLCEPVPRGFYTSEFNSSSYSECPTSNYIGAAYCGNGLHSCDAGDYYDDFLQACMPAPPGYYVPLPGSLAYYACPPGTYAPTNRSTTCLDVSAGEYNPFSAASAPYDYCATAVFDAAVNCVSDSYYEAPSLALTMINQTMGLDNPVGIGISTNGDIYFTDSGNNRIGLVLQSGVSFASFAGSKSFTAGMADGTGTNSKFNAPSGICVDSLQVIYVADTSNNRIRRITSSGLVTTLAGSSTAGLVDGTGTSAQFDQPIAIAVSQDRVLYVTDNSAAIREITTSGKVTLLAGSQNNTIGVHDGIGTAATFGNLYGITIDTLGFVYVIDGGNSLIREIATDTSTGFAYGEVRTVAGTGANSYYDGAGLMASLNYPWGIAVDTERTLYFTSTGYGLIRRLTTTAGTNGFSMFTDGAGTVATFSGPHGIAIDIDGSLIVADTFSSTIRKVAIYNISCSKGEFFNGEFCTSVPKGYYVPPTEPSIFYGCPAGSYNTATGSTECLSTPYGNFTPTSGHHQFYPCPNNTYYYIEGAGECKVISDPPTSFPTQIIVRKPDRFYLVVIGICVAISVIFSVVSCVYCYYKCWKDSTEEHKEHTHRHDVEHAVESDTTIQVHVVTDYVSTRQRMIDQQYERQPHDELSQYALNERERGERQHTKQVVTVARMRHTGALGHLPPPARAGTSSPTLSPASQHSLPVSPTRHRDRDRSASPNPNDSARNRDRGRGRGIAHERASPPRRPAVAVPALDLAELERQQQLQLQQLQQSVSAINNSFRQSSFSDRVTSRSSDQAANEEVGLQLTTSARSNSYKSPRTPIDQSALPLLSSRSSNDANGNYGKANGAPISSRSNGSNGSGNNENNNNTLTAPVSHRSNSSHGSNGSKHNTAVAATAATAAAVAPATNRSNSSNGSGRQTSRSRSGEDDIRLPVVTSSRSSDRGRYQARSSPVGLPPLAPLSSNYPNNASSNPNAHRQQQQQRQQPQGEEDEELALALMLSMSLSMSASADAMDNYNTTVYNNSGSFRQQQYQPIGHPSISASNSWEQEELCDHWINQT